MGSTEGAQAMPQPFEIVQEMDVEATPEEVWDAIATGPGMDSWFLGHMEIEPRQGGEVKWTMGETMPATVTTWDPPNRIVTTGTQFEDGSRHQFDYTVTEREGGHSNVRYVHSGMLGGDWEAEYEAMQEGDPMYFFKLAQYLKHFKGRFATTVEMFGPVVPDEDQVMAGYRRALGLGDDVAVGDRVSLTPEGVAPIEGEIDCISQHFLGVLSDDAIYRFIHAYTGATMLGHHFFAPGANKEQLERDWTSWLDRTFAPG
jgi:uncharacterized protein YndB with AHSA1/START domain